VRLKGSKDICVVFELTDKCFIAFAELNAKLGKSLRDTFL
jgi:hypothetical protein